MLISIIMMIMVLDEVVVFLTQKCEYGTYGHVPSNLPFTLRRLDEDGSTCTKDSLQTVGRWMPVSSMYLLNE